MPHYFDTDENQSIRVVSDVSAGITPYILDTKKFVDSENLFEIKNSGSLFCSIHSSLGQTITGNNVKYYLGSPDLESAAFVELYMSSNGAGFDLESKNGSNYASIETTDDSLYFDLNSGNKGIFFQPAAAITVTPYAFNTPLIHTGGNLVEVKNRDTSVFKVGVSGEIGLKPLTKAQRSGLTPYTGMIMYQSDNEPGLRFYDGTNWIRISGVID